MPEAGASAVGDGFQREGLVVAGIEGQLPGGTAGGLQGFGAQRDAAHPGALQPEGFIHRVRGARQEHGVEGGLGHGPASAGPCLVGVADGAGQALGDLAVGAQAGAEAVGEGAPVLGWIEFVAREAVFGADARRRPGGVDDLDVATVGALVESAAGAGTEQALQSGIAETVGRVLAMASAAASLSRPGDAAEIEAITDAMIRLLVGTPLRSDGQLTIKSLSRLRAEHNQLRTDFQ